MVDNKDNYEIIPLNFSGGGMGGVPQYSPTNKAELIDKIKPEPIVEIIRNKLLGNHLVNGEWVSIPALRRNSLTEIGAWEIANLMLGVSTISVSISKLSDHEIKQRLLRIAKSAQRMLLSNWKEYGIHNVSQFDYVHQIVFSNTLVVLKQADDASIQDLLKATVYENRNVTTQPKENKTNKISRMLGFKD